MTESTVSNSPLRSIVAIVLGLLVTAALSTAADLALYAGGVFPAPGTPMSNAQFALATAYRVLFAVAGGYVAARLAPRRPMKHALILGGIGSALALAGLVVTWGKPGYGPAWYPIALVLTALPATWAGARLCRVRA
jgi:hypothetical protein